MRSESRRLQKNLTTTDLSAIIINRNLVLIKCRDSQTLYGEWDSFTRVIHVDLWLQICTQMKTNQDFDVASTEGEDFCDVRK